MTWNPIIGELISVCFRKKALKVSKGRRGWEWRLQEKGFESFKEKKRLGMEVLLAHGGFSSDFPLLVDNMLRHGVSRGYMYARPRLGDTFKLCLKLQEKGFESFKAKKKLGMEGLHEIIFPGQKFEIRSAILCVRGPKSLRKKIELDPGNIEIASATSKFQ
ncbi:Hypothetical predicted protein [Paramuricea clavata]|uniref:Uncharacterized protein n=1 Tax=Paramuricea clavata TaxID=317549 RepID=A0A6S7GJC8_PARCT|nr:Hypothetical predicted protein [Paramuricea clavata]